MDAMSMPPPLAEIYRWGILHGEKTWNTGVGGHRGDKQMNITIA